jgi:uncharacterized protein YndB with AHSA1/START domain
MSHPFEVSAEITVDATPEQVWDAIATGPGIDSWFMGKSEVDPREGGRGSFSIMGETQGSTVTAWEPAKRFAYRSDDDDQGNFMAFEYLIEGREGGSTTVRFVHSGFLGDDWESEYDALSVGDAMYLRKLGQYVEHFAPRTARWSIFLPGPVVGREGAGWEAYTDAFGLSRDAKAGDRARVAIDGIEPQDGVVAFTHSPQFLCIRTDDALYMFMHGHMDMVFIEQHSFADTVAGADEQETAAAWQKWAETSFA